MGGWVGGGTGGGGEAATKFEVAEARMRRWWLFRRATLGRAARGWLGAAKAQSWVHPHTCTQVLVVTQLPASGWAHMLAGGLGMIRTTIVQAQACTPMPWPAVLLRGCTWA